jgi:hypothetical protein
MTGPAILYSVFKLHPRGRAEFVSDAGSISSAHFIATEYSAAKPFHCIIRGGEHAEVQHFRHGKLSSI